MCLLRRQSVLSPADAASDKTLPIPRYRAFFLAALIVVLTTGAGWGVWFLWQIASTGKVTGVSLHAINAHGQTVIYGFLGLFIMGFAYQAFPRLWQRPLAIPVLCKPVLAMMVVGMFLLAIAELRAGHPLAGGLVVVGGAIQTFGVIAFVVQIWLTFRAGGTRLEGATAMILVASIFFMVHTPLNAWHTFNLVNADSKYEAIYYTSIYQPALRYLQFHGMTMLMVLGVGSRLLPSFFAIPRPGSRKLWIALVTVTLCVVGESVIFITFRLLEDHRIAALLLLPWLGLLAVSVAMIWPWRIWRPLRDEVGRAERMGKFARASLAWLVISLLMTIAQPLWSHAAGTYFSHAWYGASRQAFTVGFATMMIVGFTLKIVPTLNGVFPNALPRMTHVFVLLNAGLILHLVAQVMTDFLPSASRMLPPAGAMQWAALLLWAAHLLWCMSQGTRAVSKPRISATLPLRVVGSTSHS